MVFDTNKDKGKAGLALAIAYYGSNGYVVSIPLDDTQDYDLVVDNGTLQRVQVKSTGSLSKNGTKYVANLRSTGGTKGIGYGTVIEGSCDLLFVLTADKKMYEYKICDLTQVSTLTIEPEFEVTI